MPDWNSDYIAVDWGSTNRRAYRIGANGAVADSLIDQRGVLTVDRAEFGDAVAEIRSHLGDCPMVLAGVVGSNKGWHETPYVACPAGAEEIASNIYWVDGRTGIVPGVCQNDLPDVMRGEEVQALGAIGAGMAPPEGLICLPGTHSKWVRMESGRLASFYTAMTGELFSLLKRHSVLAPQLQDEVSAGPAFGEGVADALQAKPLSPALFGIRARHLLGKATGDGASYASGLLIGTDWREGAASGDGSVITLVGSPGLNALYAQAASIAGHQTKTVDGADAFLAGIAVLKKHFR